MPDGDSDYDFRSSARLPVHSPPRRSPAVPSSDFLPRGISNSHLSGPLLSSLTYQPETYNPLSGSLSNQSRLEEITSSDPNGFYQSHTSNDPQDTPTLDDGSPSVKDSIGITTAASPPTSPNLSQHFDSAPYRRNRSTPRSFQLRSTSGSYSTSQTTNTARAPPPPPPSRPPPEGHIGPRNRQSSFRDLVERFNQPVDEIPPLPSRSVSAFSSRAPSPSPSFSSRSRPETQTFEIQTLQSGLNSPTSITFRPNYDRSAHSQPNFNYQTQSSSRDKNVVSIEDKPLRRPLFGELLTIDTAINDRPGHGIFQSHPRRRGSESSISSPHPFLGDSTRFAISPSSPTAWYLGYTHSLEAVNRRPSEAGAGSQKHHRSRSDASWATLKPNVTSPLTTDMATTANPSPVPAMHFEGGYSTKSRIPVASRRGSRASDSSNPSSPSTRTNSAVGFHPIHQSNSPSIPLAPKGSSRLPKPLHISPVSTTTSIESQPFFTAVKSPGHRSVTHSHGSAAPRHLPDKGSLKVYVSAPPPKTSPPLRSSRPRQPVSSASTAASRAKVVERVSRFQTGQNADETMHNARARSRKPPELGNVDFAARRQRIQQAFNRSVQETVKREEEAAERRRIARYKRDEQVRSMLIREGELRKMASMESSSTPVQQQRPSDDFLQPNSSSPLDDPPVTPDASAPQHDKSRELGVSTVTNSNNSDANHSENTESNPRLSLADSPTLGTSSVSHLLVASDNVNNTDIPLSSAVTTATDDSGSTDFDPEPQVGLDNQESHRNLLSRIMRLRESSSSSDCDEDEDEDDLCDEELDEKESIQIMLDPSRATFFLDGITHDSRHKFEASKNAGSDTTGGHDDVNRWSMASWASSTREQQSSVDSQCDAEEESTEHTEQRPMPLWNENSSLRRQATLDSFHNKPARVLESHKRQRSQPDSLIRKGGWDSKTATQLYLQQLARGDLDDPLDKPWNPLDAHDNNETIPNTSSLGNDSAFTSRRGDLDTTDHVHNKANLTLRDDWENASPSIADWIQVAAEDDPPTPPPKNDDNSRPLPSTGGQYTSSASKPSDTTSDSMQANHSLTGLGLAIRVHSPLDEVSGTSMPPMPTYSPPPAPREEISLTSPFQQPTTLTQSVSPSIYTSQPPSSILSSDPFPIIEENDSVRHSEDSYMTRLGYTPSPPTVASSATSQYQIPASHPAAEPQAGPLSPEQKQLRQRRNVIKELVDTEYTYGNDMKVVDDIYKGTSSSCLDLSQEDVKILFANSDQIVQFSMNFLDALKQAARSVYVMPKSARWNKKTGQGNSRAESPGGTATSTSDPSNAEQDHFTFIGHVFVENMSQIEKAYTEYLKNHDAANKKLQVLQRNPKVALWLKECRDCAADLTDAWNLDALLVKPVQRLVKYPLLLNQLIAATPSDHPDHAALTQALEAVTKISVRINDLKKRADVVGQVVSNRKRKDSDVRSGFTKAFGRRTEKLRQQVGLSEMYEDTDYNSLANRYSEHFFQLQVVMRDVEMYTREMKAGMEKFNDYVTSIQGCIDVAQSNYAEIESKWHRMGIYVREIMNVALPDHLAAVRKGVIDPMLTLLKLYEGPQKVMTKRNKRLLDYARYKSVIDRGDKADKRTTEQGEQFSVLNDALKDELPRLFNLTAQLMEACLKKFVSIQEGWYQILQQKLGPVLDRFPGDVSSIVSDWSADFPFADAQILSLALCNGSLLLEVGNLSNFNAALADGPSSPRRPSTVTSSSARTTSGTLDSSPKVSNDLGTIGTSMHSYSMDGQTDKHMANGIHSYTGVSSRTRASSSISNVARPGANTESGSEQTGPAVAVQALSPGRPSTASTGRQHESFHTAPRLSLELPFMQESLLQETRTLESTASPARFSGFFSSAMPMSDSPMQDASTHAHAHAHDHANAPANPATTAINANPKVLFLAASLYEFNIDKSRREAGYPYLTYTEGEVFDVIAEKGELWLAKNQDDPSEQVGWIWTQHFAKLPG